MRRILDFLRADDLPPMTRPNYTAEVRHMLLWAIFANLVDGSFSSIVVAKTFSSPLLIPIVWATPMLANFLTFFWGAVVRDRAKVRTFVLLAICAVVSAGSIAFTPVDWHPWSGWLFAGQVAAARIFMSGLVTARTSIWRSNYPQSHRARIAGRLQTLSALIMIVMGATVSLLFDRHAEYYRLVYPAIAIIGVLSLIPFRRIRVRGEAEELNQLRSHLAAGVGDRGGQWANFRRSLRESLSILKRDRGFARYCSAQYLLGSANFMVDPVLTLFITQSLGLGYFGSYLLMEQIPTVVALLAIARWAGLYDRVGVLRFRVINSAFWLASIVPVTAALFVDRAALPGAATVAMALLVAGRMVNGLARGGGSIAWNLGHLHFAGPHNSDLYMGIHVALTGLRGMIMPFVGTVVYGLFGPWALLLGVGLASASLAVFQRLAAGTDQPPPAHSDPTPDGSDRADVL